MVFHQEIRRPYSISLQVSKVKKNLVEEMKRDSFRDPRGGGERSIGIRCRSHLRQTHGRSSRSLKNSSSARPVQ